MAQLFSVASTWGACSFLSPVSQTKTFCYLHLKNKGHFKCAQGDLSPEEPNLPNNLCFKLCNVNYFTVDLFSKGDLFKNMKIDQIH